MRNKVIVVTKETVRTVRDKGGADEDDKLPPCGCIVLTFVLLVAFGVGCYLSFRAGWTTAGTILGTVVCVGLIPIALIIFGGVMGSIKGPK